MPELMPGRLAEPSSSTGRLAHVAVLALGLAGVLAPMLSSAQSASDSYQVEILVFGQPAGTSLEKAPRARPETLELAPAEDLQAPRAEGGQSDTAGASSESALLPAGFRSPAAPLGLGGVAERLQRAGYPVIWHQAWIQPASTRDVPGLPLLAALGQGRSDPALRGQITLSAGRFLHLGLALELESPAGLEATLTQRRRIRLGAEHYFDHPRIGVIALVTRATAPGPQASDAPGL